MTRGRSSLRTLRYVGSPYQTSLSEAGQEKFLYCMDMESISLPTTNNSIIDSNSSRRLSYSWKETERWELDIGKKYFKVS